ncbi:MAG: DoxX family protein [Mucilaginibacter polytrichastri]|nr:DoxX family protein [Mucilaginibacter polytrichastri]
MAYLNGLGKYKDAGLLVLRVGIGALFMYHGYPKLFAGPGGWQKLGGAMGAVGIHFLPAVWGFLAAVSEAIGGLLILIGFAFRPASLFLLITMIVAGSMHLQKGDGLQGAAHALEMAFVFAGLLFIGPGKYSADGK